VPSLRGNCSLTCLLESTQVIYTGGGETFGVAAQVYNGFNAHTQELPSISRCLVNQSIKDPHKATRGQKRSHIPAPPQRAAHPALRSDAGLGGGRLWPYPFGDHDLLLTENDDAAADTYDSDVDAAVYGGDEL